MVKLIHASQLTPPLKGRAYYLQYSDGIYRPYSIEAGRLVAKAIGEELEIVRPPKRSPLTQRERNERSGRVGQRVSKAQVTRTIAAIKALPRSLPQ